MHKQERPENTWYGLDCTFKDEAGAPQKAHVRIQAKKHILPAALRSEVVRLLNSSGPPRGSVPIRYDPRHPPRAWIDGLGWQDGNELYWFSLLTLFFQSILTALFLLLLGGVSRDGLLPWWWDIYKALPLMVEAFWMLIMGLIDRLMDALA